MTSQDGALIGPPPLIPTVTDPAGNVYSISHPDGYVVRNGRLCNGKALLIKLVAPDVFVQSPKGLLLWHKVLGYNSWFNTGSPIEPGAPAQQVPLSAAQLASLRGHQDAITAELAAIG